MLLFVSATQAITLPDPQGKVILVIGGKITNTGKDGKTVRLDRQMLSDIGIVESTTSTPWAKKEENYTGPLLRQVLEYVGAKGSTMRVQWRKKHSTILPISDAYNYSLLLAMDMNGKPVDSREKGPLFLLYPVEKIPGLDTTVLQNRSLSQVESIIVE
ncbi:Oxidoreductase molybdopterin binding domain protein [Marinomonas spartinae]|uniref:Oxidoreductase molybdopterin binding domain protein n=2 Tax=Marinomonas spartinae TaxID=1792290 RepID=A0A1A8TAF5_9GAMM|nr:Oxidoreductase molybdopterin binding domain protein [Marinomonas spartinae]SBS37231.1 Oxidoreductase molybdopterin binding domain protein [Marinomonas spartinae]